MTLLIQRYARPIGMLAVVSMCAAWGAVAAAAQDAGHRTMPPSSPRPTAATPTGRPTSAASRPKCWPLPAQAGNEGAGYGGERRLQHGAAGARGRARRHRLRAGFGRRDRALVKDKFDIRAQKPAMKNVVHVDPEFRRSDPARSQRARPDHVFLRLSRHDLHAGRPRRDEPEDVRRAEARRLPRHRRSFGAARRRPNVGKTLHRIEESTLRQEIEAAGFKLVGRGRFPAPSRRSARRARYFIRRCRTTSSC